MTSFSHTFKLPNLLTDKEFNHMVDKLFAFEHPLKEIDKAIDTVLSNSANFLPYNVVRVDENNILIEIACAGYTEKEIEIVAESNKLVVTGKKADKDERQYFVKGIAGRSFKHIHPISDTTIVRSAVLLNGILHVYLENVIPETSKPRVIPINTKWIKE